MKRFIAAALMVTGIVFGLSDLSAAADIKIGYVDFPKVQSESKSGKSLVNTMKTMFEDKQKQLDLRQTEIEDAMKELEGKSEIYSVDVRKQKEDKLQKDYKDLQRFKSDSEEDLNKKKSDLVTQINRDIAAVISRFGKEEGYTLILERSVVLYAPEAVDVTDKIIKAYDETK